MQLGEKALSKNETTGELEYKQITKLFENEIELLFDVEVGGKIISTTWNHPFWVEADSTGRKIQKWTEVKDLRVGDIVTLKNKSGHPITNIRHYRVPPTKVYNIEVEDNHNYFVGEDGVWVHNYFGESLVRKISSVLPGGNPIEKLDKYLTASEFKKSVKFGSEANPDHIPTDAMYELSQVAGRAEVKSLEISSTGRDAKNQARVMFKNLETHGVDAQKALYGKQGDKVIDMYANMKGKGKSTSEIKTAMENKIKAIGPALVSNHSADPTKLTTFDVAPSSISADKRKAFIKAAQSNPNIQRLLLPPKDPAYHFEIPVKNNSTNGR